MSRMPRGTGGEIGAEASPAFLEVVGRAVPRVMPLAESPTTVGRHPSNHVPIPDPLVSRRHLLLERAGDVWVARDLGAINGTYVNGRRLTADTALRSGDELLIGETRLRFHGPRSPEDVDETRGRRPLPRLTPREHDVLVALCRPLFDEGPVPQPATTKEIASELVVTEDAIKRHLLNLYDKFAIPDGTSQRRLQLARQGLLCGAVTAADAGKEKRRVAKPEGGAPSRSVIR